MEYRASSVTLSKKLSNGHSFAGGSMYDGAFASPSSNFGAGVTPNFSSLVEDYREVFGGSEASRGSSIPFLDVPELNEGKISDDVRSSQLDYSEIFGGFGDSSFVVGFEELPAEPNKRKKSEEARTQAERSSPSEASESSSWTLGNGVSSQEASHQALNGIKKFNVSYNKVSNGNANGTSCTNGTTHIAQLNAVRGYACVIDEVTPLRRAEGDKPVFKVVNEDCPENNIHERLMEGDHFKRTTADIVAGEIDKQTSRGDVFQNNSNWFKSNSMSNSFDKHEVGHRTRPSKLPTSSSLPSNFNLGNNEDSTNVDSPPYFDEEVDNNSVAATSAAALRKAIEEAQARIKMAKELMERKKAGLKNGGKLSFGDEVKTDELKKCNVSYTVNRSKMTTTAEVCKVGIPLKVFSGTRQQKTAGPCQGTTDFEVWGKVPSSTEFDGKTPWKKVSSQADHGWEEAEVSEVEEFYEVENTGEFYEVENTGEHCSPTTEVDFPLHVSGVAGKQNMTGSGHVTKNYDVQEFVSGTKEADKETPWKELRSSEVDYGEEKAEQMEAAEQFYEVDNTDKNWATILEFEEIKTMQSADKNEWKEKKIAEEVQEKSQHCGDSPKPAEEEDKSEQVETRVGIPSGIGGESDCRKDCVRSIADEEVSYHEKNEKEHQVAVKQEESEEIVQAPKENDKEEENQNELQEAIEDDKMLEIRGLKDIKHMERQSKAWACVENEKKGEEVCKLEKHEKEQSDAHEVDDNENRFISNSTTQEEMIKETLDKLHLGKKLAKILSHDDELDENGKFEEVGGNKEMLTGDVSQKEENENCQEETCQWVQSGRTETKIDLGARDEDKMRAASGEPNNLGAMDNMCKQDESGNLSRHQKSIRHRENDETVEVSEQLQACKEGGSLSQAILENSESRNELDSVKEKSNMEEREAEEADDFSQGLELTKIMRPVEDTTGDFLYKHDADDIGIIDMNFVQNPNDQPARRFEILNDSREHVEELACEMEEVEENINESEVDVSLEDDKNSTECFDEQGWVEENINESEVDVNLEDDKSGTECFDEQGWVEENINKSEVDVNLEDDKSSTECFDEQGWVEDGIYIKRAQSSDSCERKGENVELDQETEMNPCTEKDHKHHEETSVSQSAQGNEESCQESRPRQNAETEENDQATVTVEESLTGNSLPKEVELEKEHLRKIDEAREREREKERIAVERAIREARERAFAEARERAAAGRAAAGARQRATAEVRERIGKTSVEHSDKSAAEKASKEAKLKAERAAVERATAEARERALEKAMSGKAASEARKQNSQYNGPYSSSTSRYPNSSNHAVSNSTESYDEANGESAQRCKSRSERHQRITERAEKALAEKNRRDLLAQKEQAERNRLAETLDIEVKRWSSGKEGNLRALLSTLQYILGPDSGWQAIPLTDIITTTAVKKAYRKATLFVHPDKLQQRGANIQQKYICEKVFDLLKEACNKFNVEER